MRRIGTIGSLTMKVVAGRRFGHDGAITLRKQLDAYLSCLFPTAQANVTAIPQVAALALRFRIGDSSEWRGPASIGFGLNVRILLFWSRYLRRQLVVP